MSLHEAIDLKLGKAYEKVEKQYIWTGKYKALTITKIEAFKGS